MERDRLYERALKTLKIVNPCFLENFRGYWGRKLFGTRVRSLASIIDGDLKVKKVDRGYLVSGMLKPYNFRNERDMLNIDALLKATDSDRDGIITSRELRAMEQAVYKRFAKE